MNFDKIFLISDADGTLLTDDKNILEIDKVAIGEFIGGGGIFTIATGRGVSLARVVAEELNLKVPAVIFNGAAVYDFREERFLWQCELPSVAQDYVKLLMEKFPTLGVEILRNDEVNVVRTNTLEEEHIAFGCKEPLRRGLDKIPTDNWIKALTVDEPEVIDGVIEFCNQNKSYFSDVHLVRSAPVFYEMLPKGVNKGAGFKKLLELIGIKDKYIVAAGDFMNDLEMLQMADLGIAVANAEEIVKKEADLIVCDNNSGSMSEIVEYLKKAKTI
ncbi:MAG: HAD-IIB family hydrolase [Oscillospiraceae bacterium]|nr:HAD-IIB family hydrolase [Oscillospiraceae bacterium]